MQFPRKQGLVHRPFPVQAFLDTLLQICKTGLRVFQSSSADPASEDRPQPFRRNGHDAVRGGTAHDGQAVRRHGLRCRVIRKCPAHIYVSNTGDLFRLAVGKSEAEILDSPPGIAGKVTHHLDLGELAGQFPGIQYRALSRKLLR